MSLSEALASAVQYHQAGDLTAAERAYGEILSTHPECAAAWYLLGLIAYHSSRYQFALQSAQRAIELSTNYLEAYQLAGLSAHRCGHLDEAIACHREAVRIRPHDPV